MVTQSPRVFRQSKVGHDQRSSEHRPPPGQEYMLISLTSVRRRTYLDLAIDEVSDTLAGELSPIRVPQQSRPQYSEELECPVGHRSHVCRNARTVRTGHDAPRTTCCVVDPNSARSIPPLP